MYAVQRTHRQRRDRDWLPAAVRRAGWVTSGAVWGGAGVAIGGAVVAAPAMLLLWKALALGGIGVAVVGERAGRVAFRRQLARLTRGEVQLADLASRDEGTLVCVRGRIDAPATLHGVLHDTPGVYRRLRFRSGGLWIHEAAVDFVLEDDGGHRILVQAGGARWLVPPRELIDYPSAKLDHDDLPRAVRELARDAGPTIEAAERVLEPGAAVQIVGYKTVAPDVDGDVVDYRSPPQRATLRSGAALPLVITRVEDLE